jgi:ABC-2 type transport system ATP-binding protein
VAEALRESGEHIAIVTGTHPIVQAPALGSVLEAQGLVKTYRRRRVVNDVALRLQQGEIVGLLGPNGAGKTTTVGVLTTRVRPTDGRATVGGVDVATDPVHARALVAVVPQRNNLDRALTIKDNLLFHASYHGVPRAEAHRRADRLLEEFGLASRADEKPDFVSGGQAQRIMIARALMHSPAALFLDEPTTGLDPAARLFVWERIGELKDQGVTMVLTTHDMDEAAELCDRVGIMDRGKLLALDTPEALTKALPGSQTLDVTIELNGYPADQLLGAMAVLDGVENVERVMDDSNAALHTRLYVDGAASGLLLPLARLVEEHDLNLNDVGIGKPTLEDVFISLTGKALR